MPTIHRLAPALATAATLAACAGTASAAEIFLTPADSLADAVAAADQGDVLILAPGLYSTRPVQLGNGPLTIRSSDGPAATTVLLSSADAPGTLFEVNGPGPVTIEGLTLRGNTGTGPDTLLHVDRATVTLSDAVLRGPGQGAILTSGTLAVDGSTFDGLTGDGSPGAAIRAPFEGELVVRDSQFLFNGPAPGAGSGTAVAIERSRALIVDTLFQANSSDDEGGAIFVDQFSTLRVTGSTFLANSAQRGGAVTVRSGSVRILGSRFEGNTADQAGALWIENGNTPPGFDDTLAIEANRFIDNTADGPSEIFIDSPAATITNNLVVASTTNNDRLIELQTAGSAATNPGAIVTHNTIIGPITFDPQASATSALTGEVARFANNIVRGFDDNALELFGNDNPGAIDFNNVEQLGQGSEFGPNNIDADPMFVDPASGDFRLMPGSPSINAASDALIGPDALDRNGNLDTSEPTPLDAEGNPRIAPGPSGAERPDQGAFEFTPAGPSDDCPADIAFPFGILDLSDINTFIATFNAGCP